MEYSNYETITGNSKFSVNAFVISLESVVWHWHDEYEFIGVLSGSLSFLTKNEDHCLKKGDLLLVNAGEIHALKKNSEECLCMIVQVPQTFFSLQKEEDEESALFFYVNSVDEEEVLCGFELLYYRMAKIVYESLSNSRVSPYRIRAQVCSLVADLIEFSVYEIRKKKKEAKDKQEIISRLIAYINKNLMSENILEKACAELGVGRKSLDRMSVGVLGFSAKELADRLRLEQAKKLLKYSSKGMGYIMDMCGYTSENTFYRSFKRYEGVTPKEYREAVICPDERDELKGYLDYETMRVMNILKGIVEKWENRNQPER